MVGIFWVVMGGSVFILGGGALWWVYLRWWWLVVGIFWVVLGVGEWWCVITGGGTVYNSPYKILIIEISYL